MAGHVPAIRIFAAFLACRLTPITLARNSRSSPFAEGRSRGELECERGAAPAVTTRNRDPGRPWIRPPRVRQTRRARSLHPPDRRKPRDRDQREAGPQGLKTPRWSAVRRGRPIARLVACFIRSRHPGCAIRRSTPSHLREREEGTAPMRADKRKSGRSSRRFRQRD
jgi:hypothetical protein